MRPLFLACLCLSLTAFAAPDPTPHPTKSSPKGLQVQMIPDALELGIHHANLNITLNGLLAPEKEAKPGQVTASADGFTFVINEAYVKSLDRQIKALSDKGVVVTAILITYLLPGTLIFIPLYQTLSDLGLINSYGALLTTYPTFLVPFATWVLIGYFRSIPVELEEAAMIDGASRLYAFVRITLPLAAPALLSVALVPLVDSPTIALGTEALPGVRGLINFAGGLRDDSDRCAWAPQ